MLNKIKQKNNKHSKEMKSLQLKANRSNCILICVSTIRYISSMCTLYTYSYPLKGLDKVFTNPLYDAHLPSTHAQRPWN